MTYPLSQWLCDVCGKPIVEIAKGYVIWKTNDELQAFDFKIIHQVKCDRGDHIASSALEDFLGERGLAYLLSFISVGPLKIHPGSKPYCGVVNLDEFVDLFRRLQTRYYEEARRNFGDPGFIEDYSDSNEYSAYLPDTLKEIASDYPKER